MSYAEQRPPPSVRAGREQKAIFAFTGQGAQYKKMGIELLHWSAFRESLERFDASLKQLGCDWSVLGTSSPLSHTKLC